MSTTSEIPTIPTMSAGPIMPAVNISDQALSYREADDKPERKILDFTDFFQNFGSIPLHRIDPNARALPDILKSLRAEFNQMLSQMSNQGAPLSELNNASLSASPSEGSNEFLSENPSAPAIDDLSLILTIAFCFKQSLTGYKARHILEIGCRQGLLSYFLAKTAGLTHRENKVYCLSEVPPAEAFHRIIFGLGYMGANLSLLTTDKDFAVLRDDSFAFTVVNGRQWTGEPAAVVRNALRVTKKGGYLLCLTQRQALLYSRYAAKINDYEEYPVSADGSVVLVKAIDDKDKGSFGLCRNDKQKERFAELGLLVRPALDNPRALLASEVRETISLLSEMEDIALEMIDFIDDRDVKNQLNYIKETLLDYLYTTNAAYRGQCAERLQDNVAAFDACGNILANLSN